MSWNTVIGIDSPVPLQDTVMESGKDVNKNFYGRRRSVCIISNYPCSLCLPQSEDRFEHTLFYLPSSFKSRFTFHYYLHT